MADTPGDPLAGIRVIDCAGAAGAYCGRLLADLGADVILVEPPGGASVRRNEPIVVADAGPVGCFDRFVNLNKRAVSVSFGLPEGDERFAALVAGADVLIDAREGASRPVHGVGDDELRRLNPGLVHLVLSAYGETGPNAEATSDDLTTLAAGGLLSLGGYEDAGPVAVCGEQTYFARGVFGAAGALMALIERARTGRGDLVEVSGQEAIANALEDALPDCDLNGRVRRRRGERPREAGTGTYRCADGHVAVVAGRLGTAKAFAALLEWIVESGTEGAEELRDPRWSDHRYRQSPEGIDRFGAIFERFASRWGKATLYEEAQRRRIALAPVNTPAEVLADAQLEARAFFQRVVHGDVELRYPGRPYSIDGLGPFVRRPVPAPGEHNAEVFGELDSGSVAAVSTGPAGASAAAGEPAPYG